MAGIVKWIKIVVDIFDDEKILMLETLPEADTIIIIWFKLLCLAGKQNNDGVFMFNKIPYTEKMLATVFRREEAIVSKALKIFEEYGMIQIINETITIPNWDKHQSLDQLERNREYMKNYMKERRAKQAAIATGETGKVNGKVNINSADKELEIDLDVNKDIEKDKSNAYAGGQSPIDYEFIVNKFNSICKSLPKVVKLTDNRKKALTVASEALANVSFEQLFEKVASSDFLLGRKGDWRSDFDWILKPENIVKILEGNYDNKRSKATENYSDPSKYENIKMEV